MPVRSATVEDEYAKYKELRKEDVLALMEWNKKQSHLPILTEYDVIFFFQSCYFRMEPAKLCIENYCTVKTHLKEVFSIQRPAMVKETAENVIVTVLPKKTPEGYYVLFGKLMDTDSEKFNFTLANALAIMVTTLACAQLGTSDGQMVVLDCEGYGFGHFLKVNLALAKKLLFFLQEAIPVRLKAVHLINASAVVDKTFNTLKPLLGKNLLGVVNIHNKMDNFFKLVPQDVMPNEYGGTAGTVKELQEQTKINIFDNEEFFEKRMEILVDESKRVGKSKYLDEVNEFSMEGSFKKLDID